MLDVAEKGSERADNERDEYSYITNILSIL